MNFGRLGGRFGGLGPSQGGLDGCRGGLGGLLEVFEASRRHLEVF